MPNTLSTICHIFSLLLAITGTRAAQDPAHRDFFVAAHTRIRRAMVRFHSLYKRWQAGTLPAPRPHTSRARKPTSTAPAPFRPQGRRWLLNRLHSVAGNICAGQLTHLLSTAEDLPNFLTAAPQAGRILRPICRALGIETPAYATSTPRPASPRKPRTKPTTPRPNPAPWPRPTGPCHIDYFPYYPRYFADG